MSKNLLKSICWDITSRCNENCNFCYRNPDNKELDLESNIIILKKLIDFGVDKISFVGGEPFLYSRLFELLKWGRSYANNNTIFSITTNAVLLTDVVDNKVYIKQDKIDEILGLLDWITFSLDAPNKDIQYKMGRNLLHFDRVISILQYLNNINCHNKVKVNTVASCINLDYISDIYKILTRYGVKRWKIFRFLPSRGNALKYKKKYNISEDAFLDKIKDIFECNLENKIKISVNGYDSFDNSYIAISSNGQLVVYDKGKYMNKMDLLNNDIGDILEFINITRHIQKRSDFLYV